MPKCRKCGRQIAFIPGSHGSYIPVEPRPIWYRPNVRSTITVLNADGAYIRADDVAASAEGALKGWMPHWPKCEDAVAFRKVRAAAKAERKAKEEAARFEAMQPKQTTMFGGKQ